MKKFFYFLGNIATIIIAFVLYGIVQQLYFYPYKFKKIIHANTNLYTLIIVLITLVALIGIFYLYQRQLRQENNWEFNKKPHWDFKRILIALFGFFLLLLVNLAILLLFRFSPDKTSANQSLLDQISYHSGYFFPLMVIVIGPLFEEVIFRGLFFNTFFSPKTKLNKWLGILMSGFVFGYAHDPGLTKYIFVYWSMGCILAWVYMKTRDLRYSVLTHIVFNGFGFL